MEINTVQKDRVKFRTIGSAEPDWLYNRRRDGWQFYHDTPLPDRVVHLWRYTPPQNFIINKPEEAMRLLPILPEDDPRNLRQMDPGLAAFGYNRGDMATFTQKEPALQDKQIIFQDLFSAVREHRELTERFLGKLVPFHFGNFEALNAALWNTGFFLHIPDNTVIEKPIYLHRHPTGLVTTTRLLVILGKNSRATIIDDYNCHCRKDGAVANSIVELFADDSSNLTYVNIQRMGPATNTFITQRTSLGADAKSLSFFVSLASAVSKVNAGVMLDGRGAESGMYGMVIGDENQHFDHHTTHHHRAEDSLSKLDFKVILKEKALSAYTGLIRIEKDAQNCEAYQENRNLLLSKGTKAESIPELEILTDQVRCSHGATVGPIDREMMFYLKSRGVSTAEAERIIVSGFIEPLLKQIPEDLGNALREMAAVKLEGN